MLAGRDEGRAEVAPGEAPQRSRHAIGRGQAQTGALDHRRHVMRQKRMRMGVDENGAARGAPRNQLEADPAKPGQAIDPDDQRAAGPQRASRILDDRVGRTHVVEHVVGNDGVERRIEGDVLAGDLDVFALARQILDPAEEALRPLRAARPGCPDVQMRKGIGLDQPL